MSFRKMQFLRKILYIWNPRSRSEEISDQDKHSTDVVHYSQHNVEYSEPISNQRYGTENRKSPQIQVNIIIHPIKIIMINVNDNSAQSKGTFYS